MSVIVELRVPGGDFELGRILQPEPGSEVELESMVPAGERTVPFFWVYNGTGGTMEATARRHGAVTAIRQVDSFDNRSLYALEWNGDDALLDAVSEHGAQVLYGSVTEDTWDVELRFPDHQRLSAFQEDCVAADIDIEVRRLYNPTKPEGTADYGLTGPQRDALVLAVTQGYYAIPRETTTLELAEALDVSDQAVTERLRRAIVALVENTMLSADDS
jgi:predicted DNA binding protein